MMKFIASDRAAAEAKARRAFGDKLVVLSVRDLPSGDVELAASDREEPGYRGPAPGSFGARARSPAEEDRALAVARRTRSGSRLSEPIERKFGEDNLARLSSRLSHGKDGRQARESDPREARTDPDDAVAVALSSHGVSNPLAAAVIAGARGARIDDPLVRLEAGLADAFGFSPIDVIGSRTPIMLVGPTGAGKTSCGAKLAALAIERTGSAFLMSADVGRAGAIEQLQTYGDTLGADYYIAETPQEAERTLRAKKPSGAVIFDTPGISPFDAGDLAALRSFQDAADAEPVLVLPASGDAIEYEDWALAFADFGVRRIILTKFDATKRVGAGLSAAFAAGLRLAQFSETPFISEGLIDASSDFLARRLLASRPGRITVA
ncbi:MAG: hypothetical protein GC152_04955 [Alphaproteobacteria bacterium]|nr:hypothetical protein [Alphaproteobacteria bacterium]